jgi:hypothetical protein
MKTTSNKQNQDKCVSSSQLAPSGKENETTDNTQLSCNSTDFIPSASSHGEIQKAIKQGFEQKSPTRQHVLAFDMDDCLASDLLLKLLEDDEKFQAIFPTEIMNPEISQSYPVIIQSASNRKDHHLDRLNQARNQSYLTRDALNILATKLHQCSEKSQTAINDKLLVEQLFPRAHREDYYTDCLKQLDRNRRHSAAEQRLQAQTGIFQQSTRLIHASTLYNNKTPAFKQKLDVILALAGQYANDKREVEINFYDDRFYSTVNFESDLPLYDVVAFIKKNPSLIPKNVTLNFCKLDSYALEKHLKNKSQAERKYVVNQLQALSDKQCRAIAFEIYSILPLAERAVWAKYIREKSALIALTECFEKGVCYVSPSGRTKKPLYHYGLEFLRRTHSCGDIHQRKLEYCLEAWQCCSDEEKNNIFTTIYQHVDTIKGERAQTPCVTSTDFWEDILLPAAKDFIEFQQRWWHERLAQVGISMSGLSI